MDPADATTRGRARKLCGAKTKAGTKCKRRAGAGTDHKGFGKCSSHLGSTRNGQVAAAREEIAEAVASMAGDGVPVDPYEVQERLVWMAWYQVEYCRAKVRALPDEELTGRPLREEPLKVGDGQEAVYDFRGEERLNLWVVELHAAMERASRISAAAIKAGVEERRVQVVERFGEAISALLNGVLGELNLTPEQRKRAPMIVDRNLELVSVPGAG